MKARLARSGSIVMVVATAVASGALPVLNAPDVGAASSKTASLVVQAKRSLFALSDMPKGWTSSKSSNNNSSFPGADQLASCLGIPVSVVNSHPPSADSPDYNSADQLQTVSDTVSIYPSAKAARKVFAAEANPRTPSCLTTVLNGTSKATLESGFGAGTSVGTIAVTRSPASKFAPHATNFTALLPVTSQGVTLNVQLTVVTFVKGKVEQSVTLISVQGSFPATLARRLTALAASRI